MKRIIWAVSLPAKGRKNAPKRGRLEALKARMLFILNTYIEFYRAAASVFAHYFVKVH